MNKRVFKSIDTVMNFLKIFRQRLKEEAKKENCHLVDEGKELLDFQAIKECLPDPGSNAYPEYRIMIASKLNLNQLDFLIEGTEQPLKMLDQSKIITFQKQIVFINGVTYYAWVHNNIIFKTGSKIG